MKLNTYARKWDGIYTMDLVKSAITRLYQERIEWSDEEQALIAAFRSMLIAKALSEYELLRGIQWNQDLIEADEVTR